MLEITPSRPEDWLPCKTLWQLALGEGEDYIQNYYVNQYAPERVLVLRDEEGVQSMLTLLDTHQQWGDGGVTKGAYLYALATHPRAEGRGYAGFLLAYADFYLQSHGIPYLSTVPAKPSLQDFFARHGFQPCQPVDQVLGAIPPGLPQGGPPAVPVTAREYGVLREERLAGLAHARYPADYLDYQASVCTLFGGGLFRVDCPDGPACAVAYPEGDLLNVQELLAPKGQQSAVLAALLNRFPMARCQVRTPKGQSELPGATPHLLGMAKGIPPRLSPLEESFSPLAFE